ncbi:MAG: Nif3-like dinuclear metal center hexameric protein [Planctomycetaceae bacterium]
MLPLHDVIDFLSRLAPLSLAETWDNVGLLIGDRSQPVQRVMTCLTLTEDVAREAVDRGVQLVVSHHPVLFRPVQRLTADNPEGRLLLTIIGAKIAVYSPHTGYDSAAEGVNRQLAERLELSDIQPLRPLPEPHPTAATNHSDILHGGGRRGSLSPPMKLFDLLEIVKNRLGIAALQYTGDDDQPIERLGIACGSAAEFISDAVAQECQALLLGEARFHSLLEAQAAGLALILVGHYASERPAVEQLAAKIGREFASLDVWASEAERDPLRWS